MMSVDEMKLSDIQHKDLRFYHNVFIGKVNRQALALSPHVAQDGNLFLEAAPVSLVEKDGTFVLHLLDTDYSGKPHNPGIPNPGPLALARGGNSREFKVWPK